MTLIITTLIGFFLSPFIVKNLGEEANGFTQLANNFITYASLLTLALNSMAGRFITVSYYQGDKKTCEKYYSSIIIGNAIIILVLIIPAILCVCNLENIIDTSGVNANHVKLLFSFVFASFFVSQATGIFNIACFVKNSVYIQNVVQMFHSMLRAIMLIFIFSIFSAKIYFVSFVGLALAIVNLLVAFVIKKKILSDISFNVKAFDIKTIIKLISSGIWNTINQGGAILMTGLDLLIANLLIGSGPMGVLAVAKTIPTMITQLCTSINTSFSPNQTISYSANNNEDFINTLNNSSKISCAIVSVTLMVFCVFSFDFYRLWQPTLDAGMLSNLSVLTLMMYMPVCGTQALYNVFTATNKLKLNSITFLIMGVLSSITTIVVVKYTNLGVLAVAGISSVFSILRSLVFTIPYTSKLVNKKWFYYYKDVVVSLLSCGIVGLISFFIKFLISPNGWIELIVACGVSAISSLIINIFIVMNKQQRKTFLTKLFGKMRGENEKQR